MLCFNYTFDHDLYKCDNKKSLLEPCLILVYFLFSTGYNEIKKNLNTIIKINYISDGINLFLEYFILYLKIEPFIKDYKHAPLFFEYGKIPWELNMLALVALNIIISIDAGCHVTYYKPLLYVITTLHPSLGINYVIIKRASLMGIFLLALNIRYRKINKIFNYSIYPYTNIKFFLQVFYYASQHIVTGLVAQSITNDIKTTILILILPFKEYLNTL